MKGVKICFEMYPPMSQPSSLGRMISKVTTAMSYNITLVNSIKLSHQNLSHLIERISPKCDLLYLTTPDK